MKLTHMLTAAVIVTALTGCATQPQVRTLVDDSVDFSTYQTFGFVERAGTDTADYTSTLTRHLRDAASRELEARGYLRSDDPDLLVNFHLHTRQKTRITERPSTRLYYGYHRNWFGLWGAYPLERDIVEHEAHTLHVDLVDAGTRELVWEGIATGSLTRDLSAQPDRHAERAVAQIFQAYPWDAPRR
ncbi:MAG: DUF4136 domain-containing protein [Gammaproteobacteria bacterium]|nr:MAG: DUF4136 domain-containing protein [Gammaproteobacteria bacterium]